MNKKGDFSISNCLNWSLVGAGVAYRSLTADTGTQIKTKSQEAAASQASKALNARRLIFPCWMPEVSKCSCLLYEVSLLF